MTLSVPASLRAVLDGDVTALRMLITITRADGVAIRLTDHEDALVSGGQTFLPGMVVDRTALEHRDAFQIPNGELRLAFGPPLVGLGDIQSGLLSGAELTLDICDWHTPDDVITFRVGTLGELETVDELSFKAEVNGLADGLSEQVAGVYQAPCQRDLGDAGCRVPLDPPTVARSTAYALGAVVKVATGAGAGQEAFENRIYEVTVAGTTDAVPPVFDTTVGVDTVDGTATFTAREAWSRHGEITAVTDEWEFLVTLDEARSSDATWFAAGVVRFETGANAGFAREVRIWDPGTAAVILLTPLPFLPAEGDSFVITPGCDKSLATCRFKFDNVINHLGFPFVPGNDWRRDVPSLGGV